MDQAKNKKVPYFDCPKGGYHEGQALNVVCMEGTCISKLLCCNVCLSEGHKKHNTKPLKIFVNQSRDLILNQKSTQFNVDILSEMMEKSRKDCADKVVELKAKANAHFIALQEGLKTYHDTILEKIKIRGSTNSYEMLENMFQEVYEKKTPKQLMMELQRIISYIPETTTAVDEKQMQRKSQDLLQSITSANLSIFDEIVSSITKIDDIFRAFLLKVKDTDVFSSKNYKFATKFKHPSVTILSNTIVKSNSDGGYKFSIMEPEIEFGGYGIREFAFKIKESSPSNWMAVGMCHKNIIVKNNYDFKYSNLGHGAYMVSSNAGTWSNTQVDWNNKVKAFSFYKNDLIVMQANFDLRIIKFRNNNTKNIHQLKFTLIEGDPLHICVLFYYFNDEIQFVPNVKY